MDSGTAQILTDSTGAAAQNYQFSAWGEQFSAPGSATTPLAWNGLWGYYQDSGATARTWVRSRHLDVMRGRWLSPDPLGLSQGQNLYLYADNTPLGLVDPSGSILPIIAAALPFLAAAAGGALISVIIDAALARLGGRWDCYWKNREWIQSAAVGALSSLGVGLLSKILAETVGAGLLAKYGGKLWFHEFPSKLEFDVATRTYRIPASFVPGKKVWASVYKEAPGVSKIWRLGRGPFTQLVPIEVTETTYPAALRILPTDFKPEWGFGINNVLKGAAGQYSYVPPGIPLWRYGFWQPVIDSQLSGATGGTVLQLSRSQRNDTSQPDCSCR